MNDEIKAIAELIRTQDNACTAEPIFTVQSRRRIYGLDSSFSDDSVWLDEDGNEVDEPDEDADPVDREDDDDAELTGVTQVYYIDIWEHKTSCLTEQGAKDYIEAMGHHMTDARIYVESGWRNKEWIALREYLKTL